MNDVLQQLIDQFMPFAQEHIGFEYPPKLFLKQDQENADNPLGKTAFYDPAAKSVTLYITGRHPKDILRSLGHELVHHKQNCGGEFEGAGDMGPGYAQRDPHLRDMEEKANLHGSMCLRDFEDRLKKENTIYYEHLQKGAKGNMSTKDWKNKEISILLSEAWGFKFNSLQEFDEFNGTGEIQEEGEEVDEGRGPRLSSHSGENSPTQNSRSTRDVSGAVPTPPDEGDEDEEDESLEEGGAAARTGNEDKDVGRDRMLPDRVHENEKGCGDDEIQELLDPEAEEAPARVKRLSAAETAREKKKNDDAAAKEKDGEQLKEILKKVISIVKEQKMKGKSKN
tara:strand:- start:1314 stop:2327 length:1014 start_codon:yes stop_codon:yes gene_type:complete